MDEREILRSNKKPDTLFRQSHPKWKMPLSGRWNKLREHADSKENIMSIYVNPSLPDTM